MCIIISCKPDNNNAENENNESYGNSINNNKSEKDYVCLLGFEKNTFHQWQHVHEIWAKENSDLFPITTGMSIDELNQFISNSDNTTDGGKFSPVMIMKKSITNRKGYYSIFISGESTLWCDVVLDSYKVSSIWVMAGDRENISNIFFRLGGKGIHKGAWISDRCASPAKLDIRQEE